MCPRANVVEALVVVVQCGDVLSVGGAECLVEIIGGGKVAEHSSQWRCARQVVGARLSVLARAERTGRPGVQLGGIDTLLR